MPTDSHLVSVIIPAFNHGPFVADAIFSALGQTHKRIEVIVVDNASSDNTAEVLAAIKDPRVRSFKFSRHNIGAVRNFGAHQSLGDVLAFLDADDRWMPDKLERQLPHLAAPGVCCVGTEFAGIGEPRYHKAKFRFGTLPEYRDYTRYEIALENPVALSSAMIRAEDFRKIGGFCEHPDFLYIEDWECWLRLAQFGAVRVLHSPLIAYRIARSKDRDRRSIALAGIKVLDRQCELGFPAGAPLEAARGNVYLTVAKACLEQGDPRAGSFYYSGLKQSPGLRNKLRAISGLLLCSLPHRLRGALLELYYSLPAGRAPTLET